MIHGYHVILPMYGFWLPNDPRGSWSEYVRQWELACFGKSTFGISRKELSELTSEQIRNRDSSIAALCFPPVSLDGYQALGIANAFADHCSKNNYTLWACSILPEHTHLVIARHTFDVEQMANLMKGAATRELIANQRHPLQRFATTGKRPPPMWSSHCWKVYLDSENAIEQAIHYVEENPEKEGKKPQRWPFITPFTGIPRSGWTAYH